MRILMYETSILHEKAETLLVVSSDICQILKRGDICQIKTASLMPRWKEICLYLVPPGSRCLSIVNSI